MATITRRRNKGHTYYYAVQSQRINGKPRLVMQKYLGTAKDIIGAVEGTRKPLEPKKVKVFSFGGVAACWSMAERLQLIQTINKHAPKRNQGLSVGHYITLAAINRCVKPTSKLAFAEWYAETSLARLCPAPTKLLSSQSFWNHMEKLDADTIRRIEHDFTEQVIEEFGVDLRCLAYDATNFFTHIHTFNSRNTIAQRGKSKEHRSDLRIVGLALLVSMDFHIPLFHETYPGNTHDSKTFASVTDELVERYRLFRKYCTDITLVFDKGNNSQENLTELAASKTYHFVGSLPYDHHPELLKIPRKKFNTVAHDRLDGVEAYRTKKKVFGSDDERTILITYNEKLFFGQLQSILEGLQKRTAKLRDLQRSLRRRATGKVTRGKALTLDSVRRQVQKILTGQHMKKLIKTEIANEDGFVRLTYKCDRVALERLTREVLGKTILFTDNDSWSDEEIILAYRGQSHVEDAFRRMKDPHFISIRPMYHWTDPMIRVHAFYCVLALTIASLTVRELYRHGISISIPRCFSLLNKIDEVALIWPRSPGRPSPSSASSRSDSFQLSDMNSEQKRIFQALNLQRLAPPLYNTNGSP